VPSLGEIMTKDPFSVASTTTVSEVAAAMVKGRVGSAIVMDGSWLAGIFTERDVLRAAASGKDLTSSRVADWMTPDPMTAEPGMEAEEAAQVMLSRGFRHLPVVEGGKVTGVVSLRDVLSTRVVRRPG
jgi:CBS domain-containing protein